MEVVFQPLGLHVEVEAGATILEAAQKGGVGISAICGGVGSCDTCRVRLSDPDQISPPTETERDALGTNGLAAGMRLACQTEILGPLRVEVPPESMTATQRTQVEGLEGSLEFQPAVRILDLTLLPAASDDLQADFERLRAAASREGRPGLECSNLAALKQIPGVLRTNQWQVRVVARGSELVCVAPPGTPVLGMAVDIGTTKVAGYLVDLATGETLAMKGIMNPQIAFGEDVMARITHCLMHDHGGEDLQKAIIRALDDLARDLCTEAGARTGRDAPDYEPSQIVESVMVGNTAMHHLLLGLPVAQLGRAPYVAARSSPMDLWGSELGLAFSPGATVHFPANIAGFVGADHLSMLLATDTHKREGVVVSLDIGTNTEITLLAHGRMISCSTASGPAFEGAHIRNGMRAAEGAIERVRINDGELAFQTIGNTAPIGICGSGILDAVAQLKLCGAINEKGALNEEHPLVRVRDGRPEVLLAGAELTGTGRDMAMSRADINEIQLAKGAMRAGLELLFQAGGVTAAEVDDFIVAGAFGTYISVEAALAIGMFPHIPLDRFHQVGNAAGMGAKQALLSTARRAEAAEIAQRVEYLELTVNERFQEEFLKAMYL